MISHTISPRCVDLWQVRVERITSVMAQEQSWFCLSVSELSRYLHLGLSLNRKLTPPLKVLTQPFCSELCRGELSCRERVFLAGLIKLTGTSVTAV